MTDMTSYAASFASPNGGDNMSAVRALALGRLNSTRKRIAGALAENGREETAWALLSFLPGKGTAWRPETGLALLAHRNQQHGLAGLQWAAAAASMGGSGTFKIRVETPQWLYLDGWLRAVSGDCILRADSSADGGSVVIESDLGSTTYRCSADNRWSPAADASGPWAAFASGGLAPRYVTVTGIRHTVEGFPWISDAPQPACHEPQSAAASRSLESMQPLESIQQGWKIIVNHVPVYGGWVADTAAGCLLIESSGTHSAKSGSSYDHPGLIAIEPPECPVFCGEILVHECSHQQLLVYTMVAPLVTRGTEETYYSPIKRANRPIDRVLTGAHAVGNMIVYYAQLRQTMQLDPRSRERFDRHCQWFSEDYRPALDRSKSLTEAGRELWAGLCKAVDFAMEA
jgi:HEXXH motif-containing protein